MQVEIKIVLYSAADCAVVRESLQKDLVAEETHENHFFDTPDSTLRNNGAHLRLRFVNDVKCTLALKEHATYECGTATRWSKESSVDVGAGRAFTTDPLSLLANNNSTNVVLSTLKQHFNPQSLRHIGGFTTKRSIYKWDSCKSQPGLIMRLDHTTYPFGQRYEIEVPDIVVPVQDVLDEISLSLDSLNVGYAMAQESKLEAFLNGTRAALAKSHMVQDAKLILKSRADFEVLSSRLQTTFLAREEQTNYFFDGPNRELQSEGAHLRVRVVGDKYVAVIKEHQGISDGSSIYWGRQVDLSAAIFEEMIRHPSSFLNTNTAIAQALNTKFNISSLQFIGSFQNTRTIYDWSSARCQSGLAIHLDHTVFPFGERFEVEVPNINVPLADVIDELTAALLGLGVQSEMGTDSKFNVFFSGITAAQS